MLMTQQFDLVITDILMPDKTGLDVQMWLNGKTNRPKVIAISGGSPSFDQNFLLRLSEGLAADKILPKPFNRETFQQAVADVLQ